MRQGIIYRYTAPNGKIYIGQTISETHRKAVHRNQAKNPKDYFHKAIAKYGFDAFKYDVIFRTASKDESRLKFLLNTMESYYIRKFQSNNPDIGYNLTTGGEGFSGKHSEETKKKMSESHRGLDNHQKGRNHNDISKVQIAQTKMGGEYVINQYTKEGVFIASYPTYVEAAKAVGALKTSIHNCTTGLSKTCKGFIWRRESIIHQNLSTTKNS